MHEGVSGHCFVLAKSHILTLLQAAPTANGLPGQLPLIVTRVDSFMVLSSLKSKMCKRFQHNLLIFERNCNEIYRSIFKTLSWLEIFAKKCYPCLYFGILQVNLIGGDISNIF